MYNLQTLFRGYFIGNYDVIGLGDKMKELTNKITGLTKLPVETEWVEFKENLSNPQTIGEYISSLSNSTALASKK